MPLKEGNHQFGTHLLCASACRLCMGAIVVYIFEV